MFVCFIIHSQDTEGINNLVEDIKHYDYFYLKSTGTLKLNVLMFVFKKEILENTNYTEMINAVQNDSIRRQDVSNWEEAMFWINYHKSVCGLIVK
ncbi:hypothetical protein [Diatraea saccharalis granulovirus]|uniref:Uncharacterized protein n=1 Tax=Diatraea saccharalis granulovirus TaxID=1675862 RepID=A0A0R7EYX5_9BBAC|nr:hypothetical protein [Diatraea saccharalis granulovirus]AKN80784.1 hypothetical protein [Diatraea saccharalis granulovirus]